MRAMKLWTLSITAFVAVLIGAGITVGIMLWEPWDNSETSLADRIATCDRVYSHLSPDDPTRTSCSRVAAESQGKWECWVRYPDSTGALLACLADLQ